MRASPTTKATLDHSGEFLREQKSKGFPSKFACSIFCGLAFPRLPSPEQGGKAKSQTAKRRACERRTVFPSLRNSPVRYSVVQHFPGCPLQSKEERLNHKPQNVEHANAEPSSPAFEIRLFDILRFIICRLPSTTAKQEKAESQTAERRTCERRTVFPSLRNSLVRYSAVQHFHLLPSPEQGRKAKSQTAEHRTCELRSVFLLKCLGSSFSGLASTRQVRQEGK